MLQSKAKEHTNKSPYVNQTKNNLKIYLKNFELKRNKKLQTKKYK